MLCRCEGLEERLETLRKERQPGSAAAVPPELLAQHAAGIESLTLELATLQV